MYKTILVPLDGTKRAEAILPYVEDLLKQSHPSKAILLRVVEPEYSDPKLGWAYTQDYVNYERVTKEAEEYLGTIQDKLRSKGLKAETYIANGSPVNGIVKSADHRNVDLIAMSSHGRTGLSKVLFGSVAADILHQVKQPVLIIHANGHR